MEQVAAGQLFPDLFVRVTASEQGVTRIRMSAGPPEDVPECPPDALGIAALAVAQLREYAAGKRRQFDVPLNLQGTAFQLSVWRKLLEIPYGETTTYREIAILLGKPLAVRAVGTANGANPIPLIVPCHRVVATGGGLGGFSAGLHIKERLLQLEGASPRPGQSAFSFR